MGVENRQKNIVISYNIVKEYTLQAGKPMPYRSLITSIISFIGVKEDTAREYLNTLLLGIVISNKTYKIVDKEGGLQCQ